MKTTEELKAEEKTLWEALQTAERPYKKALNEWSDTFRAVQEAEVRDKILAELKSEQAATPPPESQIKTPNGS